MSASIAFLCRNPQHRAHPDIISSEVTINEGERAVCPLGAVDEHVWERTQPTSLDAVRQRLVHGQRAMA
jgi:hypothetical protein